MVLNILPAKVIIDEEGKTLPIISMVEGKTIYQPWYKIVKGKLERGHRSTYIPKGIFLLPSSKVVPEEDVKLYLQSGLYLQDLSIFLVREQYRRFYYAQVDDIFAAQRQQDYIIMQYHKFKRYAPKRLLDIVKIILEVSNITLKVRNRQVHLETFEDSTTKELLVLSGKIHAIAANAPLFAGKSAKQTSIDAICAGLNEYREYLRKFYFRPVYKRINYARRNLFRAIEHINSQEFTKARICIFRAANWLIVPKGEKSPKTP